jgi:hypothetical protein
LDVGFGAAGRSGGGHGVVCPKQETTLRQSLDNHFVCTANIDSRLSGFAAFQSSDKAEVQFGGNADESSHEIKLSKMYIRIQEIGGEDYAG